jgi:peroxiredoxin
MGYAGGEVNKKHLEFKELLLEEGKKMKQYDVINNTFSEIIGVIHFRGGWRQYVFTAYPEIDMTRSCHKEIDVFIDKLMDDWKKAKKKYGASSKYIQDYDT